MIAGRRARKRSLIRSTALTEVKARTLSSTDGVAVFQAGSPSELGHSTPLSPYAFPAPQQEIVMYLRQLATLHAAGILNDEEFSAARGRLLGS